MGIKNKKAKKYLFLLIVFIICYHVCLLLVMGKEQIRLRWETKEIFLPIYLKYGYKLDLGKIKIDKEKKIFQCEFFIKNHDSLFKYTKKVNKMRKSIERYLENHNNYFLNDNYHIKVLVFSNHGERIIITNRQIFEDEKSLSKGLKNVDVRINGDLALLEGYHDLISLRLSYTAINDLTTFGYFPNLKYIASYHTFSKRQTEAIHKYIPNCQIKDYGEANISWE